MIIKPHSSVILILSVTNNVNSLYSSQPDIILPAGIGINNTLNGHQVKELGIKIEILCTENIKSATPVYTTGPEISKATHHATTKATQLRLYTTTLA